MLTYYREPYCYELNGLSLRCRHTDGAQMTLSFRRSTLTIQKENEQAEQSYTCQKADDGLYFVHSEELCLTLDLLHGQGCLHSQAQPGQLSPLCLDGGAGFPPSASLLKHRTLSLLMGPALRMHHTFHAGEEVLLRDGWVFSFFTAPALSCVFLMDTCQLRAVAAIWEDGPQAVDAAFYATCLSGENDDQLDYQRHLLYLKPFNPLCDKPMHGGMRQFIAPATRELDGQSFLIRWTDGGQAALRIQSGTVLLDTGEGIRRYPVQSIVKASDDAYLLLLSASSADDSRYPTIALDLRTGAAAMISAFVVPGERLVRFETRLGCIRAQAMPPHFTERLVGKRVVWTYNPYDEIMHIYISGSRFRLGHWDGVASPCPSEDERRSLAWIARRAQQYPIYEEPAFYLRLGEGLYLYGVVERNINRFFSEQGGNLLIVCFQEGLMRYAGRCIGRNATQDIEDMRIGAVGRYVDTPDQAEYDEGPLY